MAISRYRNLSLLDNHYLETPNELSETDMNNISCLNIRTSSEDRLDTLAEKYLGDSSYWWIICHMNNLNHAFDFEPGRILRIPVNVNDFLKLI